jgi:endogenous inhibitor of DNA gyrase (YacG/DUF329 family)
VNGTTLVPCPGCGRDLTVPRGPVVAAQRRGVEFIQFCSRRCQRRHIALQGGHQQEENARRHLPDHLVER